MIPRPIPPLTALSVLVTRPAAQGASLCARIAALGGEAVAFPVMTIEPTITDTNPAASDWTIFVSANAAQYGLGKVSDGGRIAAIGNATAAVLKSANKTPDIVAPPPHTSENLLAMPELSTVAGQRFLIVRGVGGRDTLRTELTQRGAIVEYLDVYRRAPAAPSAGEVFALEERWQSGGIDVVTLTSAEILDCLLNALTAHGRELLKHTPYVAASERIAAAAREHGLAGQGILSRAPDDESLLGAIGQWHARAKSMTI